MYRKSRLSFYNSDNYRINFVQFCLIRARNPVVVAPIIASYCVVSAILGHIFLKEKLKPAQYACILAVIAGIIVIGFTGD